MPNNQIELGEFTYNVADMDVQGTTPNRSWQTIGDLIDIGPGAHLAEVYAEITAFNLDGGSNAAPSGGTRVTIQLDTLPGPTVDAWQQPPTGPSIIFPEMPTLPQDVIVGDAILARYVRPIFTVIEGPVEPGSTATITFSLSVLITSS